MIEEKDLIEAGRIFKPHGYKGELKMDLEFDLDGTEILKFPLFVKIDNIPVPFFGEWSRGAGAGVIVKLRYVDSDKEAATLSNRTLYMLKPDLARCLGIEGSELDEIIEGVEGFTVVDAETGNIIGVVDETTEGVEYDYLAVRRENGEGIVEIPFIDEFVEEITVGEEGKPGQLTVRLPEGFLEL